MRLCYNSILVIFNYIYKIKLGKVGTNELNKTLIGISDKRYSRINAEDYRVSTYTNELIKAQRDIVDDLRKPIRDYDFDTLLKIIRKECKYLFAFGQDELMMSIINQLIIQADNIDRNDIVFTNPQLSKFEFIETDLPFDVYLANLFKYVFDVSTYEVGHPLTNEDVEKLINDIKEQRPQFIETSFLKTTTSDALFSSTFYEVPHPNNLTSKKPNDIKLFYLNANQDGLDYKNLEKYLLRNIGRYVYSRKQIKDFKDDEALESIGIEALREIKDLGVSGDELGNLLLYSFLECVLKAPKIFSNFEIASHHLSKSTAIHILSIVDEGLPYNQLVFGTSNIQDNFIDAITKTIESISEIKKKEENNYKFVSTPIFASSFDDETANRLKDVIVPTKENKTSIPVGYSIFVGYKVDINPQDYSNVAEYLDALKLKMQKDLTDNFNHIEDLIAKKGLINRSIYIYTLPFNNPILDKDEIIQNILSGGTL